MIKASLDLHDPIDIYDQLKSQFGNLSMLIKDNAAILTFQNFMAKRAILENPKRIIKGLPLTLKAFQEQQEQKKRDKKINEPFSSSMDLEEPSMEIQNTPLSEIYKSFNWKEQFKSMKVFYDAKIKDIKQKFPDPDMCNKKLNEFNNFVTSNIKNNKTLRKPFQPLITVIKRYSLDPRSDIIDIDTTFSIPALRTQEPINERKSINNRSAPYFQQILTNYSSADIGSVKRLCMLNEQNFITTLKLNQKGQEKGQLRIYRKEKQIAEFSLDIQEGPYSLMMYENFILTGDFQGHIHMIDIYNQNLCQYSNKLSYGLIVHMQKYQNKTKIPSILTLLTGQRNDYKIKLFQIEREKITNDFDSLFFHPKEQILCQGMTMTLEVLNDGKFAYGCGRNTYVCPSFNKNEREYVTHDQNVMKIKMKNSQQLIEATQRKILSLDLRACKLRNNIFEFKHDINNLELLSEHYIFYGGKAGEVGVIDSRKSNVHLWNPPEIMHRGKISDILKMGDDIISADSTGNIFGWKRKNFM